MEEWEQEFEKLFIDWPDIKAMKIYIRSLISSIEQRAREQETEKIRTAFIKNFSGAGELWFPYESPGNCTKEEADEAAQEEWDDMMETYYQKDKTT